jgi:hypothetical protein
LVSELSKVAIGLTAPAFSEHAPHHPMPQFSTRDFLVSQVYMTI